MYSLIAFILIFYVFHWVFDNVNASRILYAWKLSKHYGILKFPFFYIQSFQIPGEFIHNYVQFSPGANAKIEMLLGLALSGAAEARLLNKELVSIVKPEHFDNSKGRGAYYGEAVKIHMGRGEINGDDYLLSPAVFFLCKKLISEMEQAELENEKIEKEINF